MKKQPPRKILMTWCFKCGQVSMYEWHSQYGKHYVNGAACNGKMYKVTYRADPPPCEAI